jgi:hypothetical protein
MLDSLGRDVGDIKNNVQAIKTQMLQDIGKSAKANGSDPNNKEVLNKIATQLETIVGYKLDVQFKAFNKALNDLAEACEDLDKKKEDFKKEAKEMAKAINNDPTARANHALLQNIAANKVNIGGGGTAKPIPGQPRAISSINSGVNIISKFFQNMVGLFKKNKGIASVAAGTTGMGGGGGPPPPKPVAAGGEDDEKKKKETWKEFFKRTGQDRGSEMTGVLTGGKPIEAIVTGLGNLLSKGLSSIPFVGGFLGGLLDGILKPLSDELEYIRDMSRGMLNTYGTGIENLKGKVDEFREASLKTVSVTGQSQSLILKEQAKYYKRGITDLKTQNSVMRAGLQTATLINSDAAETSSMFADWSQHLGASEHQLNMMGRGLVNIGRQSGLTGQNLLQVAKDSKTFMENMRLAGTFTASAANNIMGIMAQAQKTGTTAGTSRIMAGLTGGLIGPAVDEGTKSTIMKAGGLGGANMMDLLAGTGTEDPEQMKRIASGMEKLIRIYSGGKNLNQMTMQERGLASQRMEIGERGLKLNEAVLIAQNLRKGAMSFDEQLAEIGDKLNRKIYAPEEARVLKENVLFEKADKTIEGFRDNMEQANPELKDALDQQVAIVNARSKEAGGAGFSRDAGESNATLLERIQKVNQEAVIAAEKKKDPSLKLLSDIYEIEAMIREYVYDAVFNLLPLIATATGAVQEWVRKASTFIKETVFPFFTTELFPLFERIGDWVFGIFKFLDPRSAAEIVANSPLTKKMKQDVEDQRLANAANAAGGFANMSPADLAKKKAAVEQALADKQAVKPGLAQDIKDAMAVKREKEFFGAGLVPQIAEIFLTPVWKANDIKEKQAREAWTKLDDSTRVLQKDLQGIQTQETFNKALQNAQTPEQRQDVQTKMDRYYELQRKSDENVGPRGILDKLKAFPEMQNILKEVGKMASNADKPGSIYTHDEYLEELLQGVPSLVSAAMPGVNVDEEVKKRQIAIDNSNAEIEANTSDTASNTRQTNVLLGTLLNVISRSARRRGTDTPIAGEDVDDSVFFDQFIDVDWVDTIARMVGNTWAQGNPGKHN